MARLSLAPEEYEQTRGSFREIAARLAIFREALVEHGFSEDDAGQFLRIWLQSVRYIDADEEEDE